MCSLTHTPEPVSLQHADCPVQVPQLSDFPLADEDEVLRLISKAPSKSCDLDPLPTWMLKMNTGTLLSALVSIVNSSLATGSFPSSLKEAIVSPILKKPGLDVKNLKNYRPVSNLAFISKLIEKVALTRINDHLCTNMLFQKFQSAYRSGHSTETALLRIKSDIMRALDDRQAVFVVLLDLSAAFDTIDYVSLLDRLYNVFGLTGHVQQWFHSYLVGRTNRVKVASELSDPQVLEFGLPQGSVVGPQLFSLFTYPLATIIERFEHIRYHFYADDTQLYIQFNPNNPGEINQALSTLSECIMDIKQWMLSNMLQLNDSKTDFFVCANSRCLSSLSDVSLQVDSEIIQPSTKIRNLGVEFDQAMRMSDQVTSICRSVNFSLRNLSRIRMYIDKLTCHAAVRAFVTSRLDNANSLLYGISSFNGSKIVQLN